MSYRCLPLSITARVNGTGSDATNSPFVFPVYSALSSFKCPRATVPSGSGLADRPSAKKELASSGWYFGWFAIGRRHPASSNTNIHALLIFNLVNSRRPQTLQKLARSPQIKPSIPRLNAQEQPVLRR
jgi:hypothetical protein